MTDPMGIAAMLRSLADGYEAGEFEHVALDLDWEVVDSQPGEVFFRVDDVRPRRQVTRITVTHKPDPALGYQVLTPLALRPGRANGGV
jgi:hypothetical protein